MEYIAIIPARGGSKGIKDKNLQLVGGISLLARAINSAKKIESISRVIVSTDSESIIEEAITHNAEVHRRRHLTSSDSAKTIDVIKDIYCDMMLSDEVCILLQPTSPLRQISDIRACINEYEGHHLVNSVVSATLCEHHPYKVVIQDDKGEMVPVRQTSDLEAPRQKLPKALRINGAIYISSFKSLIEHNSFFCHPTRFFEMGENESIDIDSYIDLNRANLIIEGKSL
ncbi:cytidylyltransferase domain-containing protein [Psychrobacter sp. Pi2-51]|uniref:acylneuraminate cytidylyltransferase family protein n=1 Tax=Psychrobacter sp. Pi2-51 TaxID=2774132 RepID=UPI001917BA77|nr:acylneuraminate cytidylyltransferase family protein [Psychrobacter sp. Pi2-51]